MPGYRAAEIRSRLDHPIIDADGHVVEFLPGLDRHLREAGVSDGLGAAFSSQELGAWHRLTPERRERVRSVRGPWWALPARNTRDLATATFPRLLHERLPELGIDFAVVYPSITITFPNLEDEKVRRRACRGANHYYAEVFAGLRDRLEPACVIPMHTPEEAVEELEYAVGELGYKAAMISGWVRRPLEGVTASDPAAAKHATWLDFLGIDSPHDYDPLWARCVELGISPAAHSMSIGWGSRQSVSNYVFNHIGHFAASGDALCKALLLGGVTKRFPGLRIGFLEGGVSWAVSLFGTIVSHWGKRNPEAIENYDPGRIDTALYTELLRKYGGSLASLPFDPALLTGFDATRVDDFAALGIERREDLRDRFVPNFFFGCEADDPTTATAFDTGSNPFGAELAAMFSSDIGHWDVPDMEEVLPEAYEQVERGWLDARQFRDFAFANVARFYTDTNPDFFAGTTVEKEVAALRAG